MSDNVVLNSHVIDANDFLAGSGFRYICELKEDSMRSNVPNGIIEDWKIIESWLGCEGRHLNQQDKERIGRAWKSYYAIGIAPSLALQPTFNNCHLQAKREKWEIVSVPSIVRDVFDRLLASDKEIAEKKEAEHKRLNQIIEQRKSNQHTASEASRGENFARFFHKQRRIWIVGMVIWASYIIFRTSDYYEVFGVELSRWDSSSFWLNLLLPPVAIIGGIYLHRWVQRGNK